MDIRLRTYHSDRTVDRANGRGMKREKALEAPLYGTKEKGACTYQFEGTKAYVVATVDPGRGKWMSMSMVKN